MSEGGGGSQTDGESFYEAVYSFYENQFRDLRQYLLNKYFYDLGSPSTAFPTSSTSSSTLNILSPNDSPAKKARTKRENKPLDEDHPSSSQNFDDVDDADEDADEDADADDNDDDDDHDEDQNENENDEDDTHIINDGYEEFELDGYKIVATKRPMIESLICTSIKLPNCKERKTND